MSILSTVLFGPNEEANCYENRMNVVGEELDAASNYKVFVH